MDPAADPRLQFVPIRFHRCYHPRRPFRVWIDPSLIEFIAQERPAIFIERLPGGREIAFTVIGARRPVPLSVTLGRWQERWERLMRRITLLFRRLPSRNIRLRRHQPLPPPPPRILRKEPDHRHRLAASA